MVLPILFHRGIYRKRKILLWSIIITISICVFFILNEKRVKNLEHVRLPVNLNPIATIKLLPPQKNIQIITNIPTVNSSTYLSDYKNIDYTLNNEFLCKHINLLSAPSKKSKKLLLITVISARDNFYRRDIIRKTWGSQRNIDKWTVQIIFILGECTEDNLQNQVQKEHKSNGDILMANFTDTYRSLTYKTLMAFKWASKYCSEASYILKTDDDVFIEIFQLIHHVTYLKDENTISCYVYHEAVPMRLHPNDIWYVSKEEYPEIFYPDYCPGTGYLVSPDVVKALYETSLVLEPQEIFWIEDVFVTGMLREQLIRKNVSTPDLLNFSQKYNVFANGDWKLWYKTSKNSDRLPWVFIQTWHEKQEEFEYDFISLWNKTLEFQHYLNQNNKQ